MYASQEKASTYGVLGDPSRLYSTVLILSDVFFGFSSYSMGPIAHFAHLGGALTGFLIMRYWNKNQFRNNRWDL